MNKHIDALDGLRAISISLVIYAHLSAANKIPRAFHATSLGLDGVLIFFVISGYLITSNLLREFQEMGTINIGSFLLQRGFRLLPASFLLILATTFLSGFGYIRLGLGDILHAITYTMDYDPSSAPPLSHLWSLSVEEQFYLMWPFVIVFAAFRGAKIACVVALLICPICRFVGWHATGAEFIVTVRRFEMVADSLAVGCLLSMIQAKLPAWTRSNASAIISFAFIVGGGFLASRAGGFMVAEVSIDSVCAAIIIHSISSKQLLISRLLSWPPLAWLGTVSYSLYLWQQLFTLTSFSVPLRTAVLPYNLLGALTCAVLSYYLLERPIRTWGRRFRPASNRVSTSIEMAA